MLAMRYLHQARVRLAEGSGPSPAWPAGPVFETGAVWMGQHLALLRQRPLSARWPMHQYTYYGYLKYGLSVAGLVGAALALAPLSYWLLPLAALGFYLVEVQFLFLFPLLLEGRTRPLRTSCQLTSRVGVGRCLSMVLPVAGYMLLGLVRPGRALHHWHTGCLAIILWYVDEVPAP
jgi:hypothetical protein